MFKNKKKKGEYGYIASQRKWEIAKTAFLFALSLAIYLTGYISTGTNKNLLSIVAVLGCLPASMCAVNMILFLRAKGCPDSLHDEISAHSEGLSQLYDCVFTSYERTYELPYKSGFQSSSLRTLCLPDPPDTPHGSRRHRLPPCRSFR